MSITGRESRRENKEIGPLSPCSAIIYSDSSFFLQKQWYCDGLRYKGETVVSQNINNIKHIYSLRFCKLFQSKKNPSFVSCSKTVLEFEKPFYCNQWTWHDNFALPTFLFCFVCHKLPEDQGFPLEMKEEKPVRGFIPEVEDFCLITEYYKGLSNKQGRVLSGEWDSPSWRTFLVPLISVNLHRGTIKIDSSVWQETETEPKNVGNNVQSMAQFLVQLPKFKSQSK